LSAGKIHFFALEFANLAISYIFLYIIRPISRNVLPTEIPTIQENNTYIRIANQSDMPWTRTTDFPGRVGTVKSAAIRYAGCARFDLYCGFNVRSKPYRPDNLTRYCDVFSTGGEMLLRGIG
jgi:hypothetical protein